MQTNANSSAISGTISTLQSIQSGVVGQEVSNQNGVNYRRRQRNEMLFKIARSRNYFSRLPTEMLAQIFLYCIPEGNWKPVPRRAPMLLTAVCRRWREVALDMPDLWRRLQFNVGYGDWRKRALCYDSCLKRSRGRQLLLTLECYDDNLTELQSLLRPYVNQVSSLTVRTFSRTCCPLAAADFGGLNELVIHGFYTVLAVPESIGQLPPNMRSLKLMNVVLTVHMLSSFKPLSWAGLTNLELILDGPNPFAQLLRWCPNLSSLTIVGIFTAIETSKAFVHPKLQTFRISGNLHVDSIDKFKAITLPNLRAFEARNTGQWPHEDFKAFLTRSQCRLESLLFSGGVVTTDGQLAEYVALFPSLELSTNPMRSGIFI
ncbi:uncharacterized protein F5147DRAFT_777752 [Suillus discolor]|uniref:F-box domain-containing protein n=1 Tax=Suillus discolor TaxID=1912936 RepID=A0A9P7EZ58_9AGAM|nr:uncharacterized protein F5147DRAFT_777752 [Suillus discolor]KAG2098258.1 hypothetical protein F5147DRAFT_777752 [Suillus discolor]